MTEGRSNNPDDGARILDSIAALDAAAWNALFPGAAEESHAYLSAVMLAQLPGFSWRVAGVFRDGRLIAAAPLFLANYRLDTTLQGAARRISDAVTRLWPGLSTLRLLCLGTPANDTCPLGFATDLSLPQREAALAALLSAVNAYAVCHGYQLLAVKDLDQETHGHLAPVLGAAGFAGLSGLPNAVLSLPAGGEDAYIASLGAATRKDVRRKLKAVAGRGLRIEYRTDLSGVLNTVIALYNETRSQSAVDYDQFETLTPAYFAGVTERLQGRAGCYLYWRDETLLGFNLLLEADGCLIDKFLGLRYPEAREHNLYVVSWMTNLRHCWARGLTTFQTGQTAYAAKCRLGSALRPTAIYFRHRNWLLDAVLRLAAPWLDPTRYDPDLAAIAARRDKKAAP